MTDNLDNSKDFEQKLKALHEKLSALNDYQKINKLEFVFPETGPYARDLYPIPLKFFEAGAKHRFRMFSGANGSGKSFSMGCEIAYHATGKYPKWWTGKRFKRLESIWIVAESGALFRDSLQKLLFGNPGEDYGTGLIPKESIKETSAFQGISGAVGSALIKNEKGHVVSISIKTFDMHREKFQAANVGLVCFDEEPPEDVYEECVMRTRGTKTTEPGIIMLAFTPLKGLTNVVMSYMPNGIFPKDGLIFEKPDYFACRVTWDDAAHLTTDDKAAMLTAIAPNLRDARTKGIPALGSGRVFPVYEEDIVIHNLKIMPHWPRAYGLDFGWHKTAAVWGAKDPDTGVLYLYGEYYHGQVASYNHAFAIKQRGEFIPGVADSGGLNSNVNDGKSALDEYVDYGLNLIPASKGQGSVMAGNSLILGLMESGLLKVTYNLENWLSEFRTYRYDAKDPNKIARNQDDHLMDATRYLVTKFDDIAKSYIDHQEEENSELNKIKRTQVNAGRSPYTGY